MNSYPPGKEPTCPVCNRNKIKAKGSQRCAECRYRPGWHLLPEGAAVASGPPPSTLFDDEWATFNQWIGRTPSEIVPCFSDKTDDGVTEIIHLTDIHVPHEHKSGLRWAVESTRGADIGVIGGDFFNAAAFSRFIETEFVSPRDEFASARCVLQYLAGAYRKVILRPGNHTDRLRKYFGSRIPPYMQFLVNLEPLKFIATDLPNVEVAKPAIPDIDGTDWITIIGDCAFTHAESHSAVLMRPADNVRKWLHRWAGKLPDVKVVCQEHNHCGGMAPSRDDPGVLLIQTPCLSEDVSYQADPRLKYGPNQIGYTRIVQRNGVTDWNESRYYLMPEAREVAA